MASTRVFILLSTTLLACDDDEPDDAIDHWWDAGADAALDVAAAPMRRTGSDVTSSSTLGSVQPQERASAGL